MYLYLFLALVFSTTCLIFAIDVLFLTEFYNLPYCPPSYFRFMCRGESYPSSFVGLQGVFFFDVPYGYAGLVLFKP